MSTPPLQTVAFERQHDHSHCLDTALAHAHTICKAKGLRLTPIRELVLKLIWQSHKPMVAYDLLPALAAAGFNSAPPTVYRALDFLQEHGLVHRIARLNAFIGCQHHNHDNNNVFFLICNSCGHVQEAEAEQPSAMLQDFASNLGFVAQEQTIEVLGICPSCFNEQQTASL